MAADSDYEPDGSASSAYPLTDRLPYYGQEPLVQGDRLFRSADPASADEDWVEIEVDSAQVQSGFSFLVEALPTASGVDPVLDTYGPDSVGTPISTVDDSPFFHGGGASVSIEPDLPGTYWVRIRPDTSGDGSSPGAYSLRAKIGQATRLAGRDRLQTAIRISGERYRDRALDGGALVVASGYGFADALAGSTLAGVLGCPLLLTHPTSLWTTVSAEVRRLGADTVYVLGGAGAVSEDVASALDSIPGVTVRRIAGDDRYDTAAAIARSAADLGDTSRLAFVVNGQCFPDALSASPAATWNGSPILLTLPDSLPAVTESAIRETGVTDVVIVGGAGVVSESVRSRLEGILGSGHVLRVAGTDRYETAERFAVWASRPAAWSGDTRPRTGTPADPRAIEALDPTTYGIASGADFPDALSGGVFCGLAGSPILLTAPDAVSPWVFDLHLVLPAGTRDYYAELVTSGLTPGRTFVFGGTGAVSQDVFAVMDAITGG